MLWDIVILAGVAVTQLVLTWYGIHVSVERKRMRNAIVIGLVGGLGVVLTIWGGIRNGRAQQSLQKQLDTIQRNTEQPPHVELNVPPPNPPPPHTTVAWKHASDPALRQPGPFFPFTENEQPMFNMGFINAGNFPVVSAKMQGALLLVPFTVDLTEVYRKNIGAVLRTESDHSGTLVPHEATISYHTFVGPKLASQDVADLNFQTKMLCLVAVVTWTDTTGTYRTAFNECFFREPPDGFNWHVGAESNREVRLK